MQLDVLDRYATHLGKRSDSVALALNSLIDKQAPVIVELGTSRSFVAGGEEGVMNPDPKYWSPEQPARWDWGAGIFSRVCGEAIEGTEATLHSIDPLDEAISIARTITSGLDAQIEFHETTSTDFLSRLETPIDLLYMDHHETCEEGAKLHLTDARLVIERNLLAEGAVIVVDDVHVHGRAREQVSKWFAERWSSGRTAAGETHHGKGKYSIPYLLTEGFEIAFEGYQVVLTRPSQG